MGADIYLNSVYEPNIAKYEPLFTKAVMERDKYLRGSAEEKKAQKQVEKYYNLMYSKGYFRDSYNATSLFAQMGLSWWQDLKLDSEGNLPVDNCKELLKIIKSRKIPNAKKIGEQMKLQGAMVDDNENSPEAWRKMFANKRLRFIKMLEMAIKLDEGLHCSV